MLHSVLVLEWTLACTIDAPLPHAAHASCHATVRPDVLQGSD